MGLHKSTDNTWFFPGLIVLAAILLLFFGDSARDWLRFERAAIGEGEIWRALSGHIVHLGWSHFALNAAGLGLVWYLVGNALTTRQWAITVLLVAAAIDIGIWFLNPELQWYVGLSGILHGMLVAGLVARIGRGHAEVIVLLVLIGAKVGWEQLSGPLPGSVASSGGAVIVDAHLYGVVAGILSGILARIRVRRAGPI